MLSCGRWSLHVTVVCAAGLLVVTNACTPIKSWWASTQSKRAEPSSNANRPLVSNAFAYARYVAMNMEDIPRKTPWTDSEIRATLVNSAAASGVPPEKILDAYAHAVPADSTSGQTARRIAQFHTQHAACVSAGGYTPRHCCQALVWPMAVLPEWSDLSPQHRDLLLKAGGNQKHSKEAISVHLSSWDSVVLEAGQQSRDDAEARFRLQGLKAWLSVCHPVMTEQPQTLTEFRSSRWFEASEGLRWDVRLHPRSRAKRVPRRIHRRSDGVIAFAETLNPKDCSVTETEVIVRRADGFLNFWVYDSVGRLSDTSHFPASADGPQHAETVEKPNPDSCMGCHYDFKSREFNVFFPSADELKLASTRHLPTLCERSGEELAEDN